MLTLTMAWRNIWRNPRRTTITIVAVVLNTAIIVITASLMEGMLERTVENVTQVVVGEVQVHAPGYRQERSFYDSIADPGRVLEEIRGRGLDAVARAYGYGLVSLGNKSAGAMFWGVDPRAEADAFRLPHEVAEGSYLDPAERWGVVLGAKLARALDAKVGSELVAVVQAADGSMGNELLHVTGILKAAGESLDRAAAIVVARDFQELFSSGGRIHEIAVTSKGRLDAREVAAMVSPVAPGLAVETWQDILPALSDLLELTGAAMWLYGMIFFLAAGLGVLNTMLMATFDRIREFGVLKALGTSPWRILLGVSVEAGLLAAVSVVVGGGLGLLGTWYFSRVGIDLGAFAYGDGVAITFSGVAMDPVWRAVIRPMLVVQPMVAMWAICVAASLYPAAKAAMLDPVRAMDAV